MNKAIRKSIDVDKYYSAKAVTDMGILVIKSRKTFVDMLRREKWINIFKPITDVKGDRTMFYIKGSNIINYLNLKKANKVK